MDRIPLNLNPNPLFAREDVFSLNGCWKFALTKSADKPQVWKKIEVPFAVETSESGVFKFVSKDDYMHYELTLDLPNDYLSTPVILHFVAIDQVADVYLNDKKIAHHEGGYFPFTIYLTSLKQGDVIDVVVQDDTDSDVFPKGKQSLDPHWIFYRPTSGIWGDVYLEKVPSSGYISSLDINANFDSKTLRISAPFSERIKTGICDVLFHDKKIASFPLNEKGEGEVNLTNDFYSWSPSSPNLYSLVIKINDDEVHSYFGFRKFSSKLINGLRVFTLNDKPLFLSGLLDQGYYNQNTGMTPLNEESITSDLTYVKACGFNCLRKHIKIEPMRYYYHCDRLGIILIQDLVSGGDKFDIVKLTYLPHFGINLTGSDNHVENINRHNPVSRILFEKDLVTTYHYLNNVTSIAIWTIFNESWGQYSARRVSKIMQDLDSTRLVDATSGWTDKGAGDFKSLHIYYQKIKAKNDHKRILSLSEWGGTSLPIDNHIYAPEPYGKHPCPSKRALLESIDKSVSKEIIPLIKKQGLSVSIYTQLSDVEAETNGLLTYDRLIQKIPSQYLIPINEKMYSAFSSTFAIEKKIG